MDVDGLLKQVHAHIDETGRRRHPPTHRAGGVGREKVGASHQQVTEHVAQQVAGVREEASALVDQNLSAVAEKLAAETSGKLDASTQQFNAQMEEKLAAATAAASGKLEEQSAGLVQRVAAAEANMEEIRKHFATLQSNVAGDLHDFEQNLKSQAIAIESARTAMAQTDDLVERVVEALELLQSSVLDQHEAVVN